MHVQNPLLFSRSSNNAHAANKHQDTNGLNPVTRVWSNNLTAAKAPSMQEESQQDERRRHVRYDELDLELRVSRRGIVGFLRLNPTADCLDFSLSGLHFGSDKAFKVDEKLVLDLKVRDLELSEINAVVVACEQTEPAAFCTRVRFCFEEKRMQDHKIKNILLQIADRLRVQTQYPE